MLDDWNVEEIKELSDQLEPIHAKYSV